MDNANLISPPDDQARAKAILDETPLPPELSTVTIELKDDYSGDPAMYLSFHVKDEVKLEDEHIARLSRYMMDVADRLLRSGVSRFPYVSLDQAA